MPKNASTTTPVNVYLDSNLSRPRICVRLVAYASIRIANQHGRWARTVWRHTPLGVEGVTEKASCAGREVAGTRVGTMTMRPSV